MGKNFLENMNLSRLEMSGWELIPITLALLTLLGVTLQIRQAHSQEKNRNKEKRQGIPRRRLNLPLIIETPISQALSVQTYDISTTGAYIPLNEMKQSMNFAGLIGKRSGIKVGDTLELTLKVGRFSQIQCQAKVVRFNTNTLTSQPEGIGIQFIEMSRRDTKKLESLILSTPETRVS